MISKRRTVSFQWIPKIIIYWVTPGTISSILIYDPYHGLSSVAMASQCSTSAVSWISRQQGRSLFNYQDDFIGVSPPCTATSDFQARGDLLTSLGLQESSEKSSSPSPVMICLGVQLDNTNNFTLSVSSERLCESETLLDQRLTKRIATKSALQSLFGKLVFVYDNNNLMTGPKGNSEFCFHETLNVPRVEAKGNIECREKIKIKKIICLTP